MARKPRPLAIALLVVSTSVARPCAAGQAPTPVLLDRGMTIGAGATVSTAVGAALARVEDAFIPARLFPERGVPRRAANVAYRLFKFALLDLPQEQLLWVVNHEVFGHGARLRERFDGPIGYRIEVPAPYGRGGGATSFEFDREPTLHELLAVSAAGMEASGAAAGLMASHAFLNGRIGAREAIRYLGFELDTFAYVLSTGDGPEEPGHDVSEFLRAYNHLAASRGARLLTPRTLRREALGALANPMLGYALAGLGRYLWTGAGDTPVPVLSVAGVRYLPLLRYQLVPYGTEWVQINELAGAVRSTTMELRVGRAPGSTPWGAGIQHRNVPLWRAWRLHAEVDVWRQPSVAGTSPEATRPARLRSGAYVRALFERAWIPTWSGTEAAVILDVGAKSSGFVPGAPLDSGVVVRAGVSLPLGRR